MAQIFKSSAAYIRKSAYVIPITLVFIAMLIVASGIFVEDFSTSYWGYRDFPTHKVNDWVIYLVALVPQLAQIGFGYMFIDDTKRRGAFLIVLAAHIVDSGTDIYYKASGLSWQWWIVAAMETEIIYTIFSEFMFLAAFGMVVELFPDFISQMGKFIGNVISSLLALSVIVAMAINPEDKSNNMNHQTDKQPFNPIQTVAERHMQSRSGNGQNNQQPETFKRGRGRPRKDSYVNPVKAPVFSQPFIENDFERVGEGFDD